MIKISSEIREAIACAAERAGNPYQFALKVGVTHATINKWLNGKSKRIREDMMCRIFPEIYQHLGEKEILNLRAIFSHMMNNAEFEYSRASVPSEIQAKKAEVDKYLLMISYIQKKLTKTDTPETLVEASSDKFLQEILDAWPKLSKSSQMKVAAFAVELLEKSGAGASEEDLEKDRAKHA